ncbi:MULTISPECIES: GNAT family N-acetyltransferase [Tsukamurella]|uniref:Lysine N-acyltransferase MbtK n=2 Tax=Tsukamurella TaxID=2060 RepID=A0A5C5S520_9ACTN|nr:MULTISPECIES: GNAT family N-acetyltransferase [Tsukamurella]NMD55457.1 acetyltransferase [Tsukamurella columbiensis]TWS30596.1 acetyltransferase [Tsukamurella conjunctivitidis]
MLDHATVGRRLEGREHPPIGDFLAGLDLPGFDLRVVDPDSSDLDVVHGWMNTPEVAAGWGQAWPREQWRRHLIEQLAGTYSVPVLVGRGGADIAYAELYRAHADVVARCYDSDPHDVGVHLAIGSPAHRGGGWGARIGAALMTAGFRADPACRRMLTEPDVRNAAAVGVGASLGMTRLGVVELPHKTAVLFAAEREKFAPRPDLRSES